MTDLTSSERQLLESAEDYAIADLRAKHGKFSPQRGPYVDGAITIGTVSVLRWAADTLGREHSILDTVERRAEAGGMPRLASVARAYQIEIRLQIDRCLAAIARAPAEPKTSQSSERDPIQALAALKQSEREEVQKWLVDFQNMQTIGLNRISRVSRGLSV